MADDILGVDLTPGMPSGAGASGQAVAAWHILTKRETYRHFDEETIAYKMLIWSQRMDAKALNGLTRQKFVKFGLLRFGVGQDLTRIMRSSFTRRIAPTSEVLADRG
ncbi:hypothetical protein ACFLXI_03095 [Chloroflexota bacterium]